MNLLYDNYNTMIDKAQQCDWWPYNNRNDAFESSCTGMHPSPYFITPIPNTCPRCNRDIIFHPHIIST
jgi:hypothetical protein